VVDRCTSTICRAASFSNAARGVNPGASVRRGSSFLAAPIFKRSSSRESCWRCSSLRRYHSCLSRRRMARSWSNRPRLRVRIYTSPSFSSSLTSTSSRTFAQGLGRKAFSSFVRRPLD